MHTTNTPCSATMNRRHQNPTCSCIACAAFDHSATMPLRPVRATGVILTAIDTETSERFTYHYQHGLLHKIPVAPSQQRPPEIKRESTRSFRTLLHDLVLEQIEQSVQRHPFFWLCVSRVLR